MVSSSLSPFPLPGAVLQLDRYDKRFELMSGDRLLGKPGFSETTERDPFFLRVLGYVGVTCVDTLDPPLLFVNSTKSQMNLFIGTLRSVLLRF